MGVLKSMSRTCKGHKIQNNKRKMKGTMWSIRTHVDVDGNIVLRNGKPCIACALTMLDYGIGKCIYSDATGDLVEERVHQLVKSSSPSIGTVLMTKPSRPPPLTLTIRNQDTFNMIAGKYEGKKKTIEGRKNTGIFRSIRVGMKIQFRWKTERVVVTVTNIEHRKDFQSMLSKMNAKGRLQDLLPGCKSIVSGIRRYKTYYRNIGSDGVIAIYFDL